MNRILVVVILVFTANSAKCQSIYLETLGNTANFYSVNYEHSIKADSSRFAWLAHGGVCFYSLMGYSLKAFPLGVSFMNRKFGKNHREMGASLTYSETLDGYYVNAPQASTDLNKVEKLYLIVNLGYRYQKPEGRFMFKIYWAPYFSLYRFSKPLEHENNNIQVFNVGIALGYKFKKFIEAF